MDTSEPSHKTAAFERLPDAARRLGVDPDYLRYRCENGSLTHYRDGSRRLWVSRAGVDALMALRAAQRAAESVLEHGLGVAEQLTVAADEARIAALKAHGFDANGRPLPRTIA